MTRQLSLFVTSGRIALAASEVGRDDDQMQQGAIVIDGLPIGRVSVVILTRPLPEFHATKESRGTLQCHGVLYVGDAERGRSLQNRLQFEYGSFTVHSSVEYLHATAHIFFTPADL